jgi:hypothetical protein
VLVTTTHLLTTRRCVEAARLGPRPRVRVGFTGRQYTDDAGQPRRWEYEAVPALDAVAMPAPSPAPADGLDVTDLALVRLGPMNATQPIATRVRIPRQKLLAPPTTACGSPATPPCVDPPDAAGRTPYRGLGMAGWSPYSLNGEESTYAAFRQRIEPASLALWRYGQVQAGAAPFWVRKVFDGPNFDQIDHGLNTGDLGSPLYLVTPVGADVTRQVVGIASRVPVDTAGTENPSVQFPALASHCPTNACEGWIDITQGAAKTWLLAQLEDHRHDDPVKFKNWRDHHPSPHGTRANGTPDWWLGEVDYYGDCRRDVDADCDHILLKNADGTDRDNCPDVFNPDQADEDDDLKGDLCAPMPVTTTVQLNTSFAHESSTRRVRQEVCQEPIWPGDPWQCWDYLVPAIANNTFEAAGTVQGIGSAVTLRGHTRATACACPAGTSEAACSRPPYNCDRQNYINPDPFLTSWKAMTVADPTSTTGAMKLKIASGFPGLVNTSEFAETARKENWGWGYWNDVAGQLAAPPTSPGSLGTVYQGLLWTWVKNYGAQRPAPAAVSLARAELRQQVAALELKEAVPPTIVLENPCRYEPHPWCPGAGPGGGGRPTRPRALMAPVLGIDAISAPAPVQQAAVVVRAADASGLVAEIDPQSHDLLASGTLGRVVAPPEARSAPAVAAVSASRRELVFFGEPAGKSDRFALRIVNLDTGAVRVRVTPSLARGVGAYAAVYHRGENAYFVLEEAFEQEARVMRLVRVDAFGQARVVGTWPFTGTWRKYALDVEPDGELAITAQASTRHGVVTLRTRRHLPTLVRSAVLIEEPLAVWTQRAEIVRSPAAAVAIERLF